MTQRWPLEEEKFFPICIKSLKRYISVYSFSTTFKIGAKLDAYDLEYDKPKLPKKKSLKAENQQWPSRYRKGGNGGAYWQVKPVKRRFTPNLHGTF